MQSGYRAARKGYLFIVNARVCFRRAGSNYTLVPRFVWQMVCVMSAFDDEEFLRLKRLPPRRQVSIVPDGPDFVVTFAPNNVVVFRHNIASELRELCHKLRWEIVSDVTPDPKDPASW